MPQAAQNIRALVSLHVPDVGTSQERVAQESNNRVTVLTVRPYSVRIDYNNHNEADECSVEMSIDDAGIDPRVLRNAEMYVYLEDLGYSRLDIVPTVGTGDLHSGNLRFVGIATSVKRSLSLGSHKKSVRIKAQDYTCLFLGNRNGFPPRFVPDYSDTLTSAWNKICDGTGYLTFDTSPPSIVSTVQRFKDQILFIPDDLKDTKLASAVSSRVSTVGAKFEIPHQEGADAWAVWQHIVGSLGLVSFIRGSRCVVTTASDFYSGDDPPRMIWGLNVSEIEEDRDQHAVSAKNIGIFSFNPITGTHLESFYPPKSDVTPKGESKKKVAASALGPDVAVHAQDYEVFQCPMPISDQKTLDAFTERVWLEHARQEMSGSFKTPTAAVWTNSQFRAADASGIPTGTQPGFSLLSLQAGDRVRVEIDQESFTLIQALPSLQARIDALRGRGYSDSLAEYIAKNLSDIATVSPEFQVHSVSIDWDVASDPGRFEIEVRYLNRIYVSGSATPAEGVHIPSIASAPL